MDIVLAEITDVLPFRFGALAVLFDRERNAMMLPSPLPPRAKRVVGRGEESRGFDEAPQRNSAGHPFMQSIRGPRQRSDQAAKRICPAGAVS
jgi:hypothetical protein